MLISIRAYLIVEALLDCLSLLSICDAASDSGKDHVEDRRDVFLYFGYGSNLLGKRLHKSAPSATSVGAAALKNYRLDFDQYTKNWQGARSTIVQTDDVTIYGVLWKIDRKEQENLDKQEGVQEEIYAPIDVSVELISNGTIVTARTYDLVGGVPMNSTFDRRPSKTYLKCFVKGAQEGNLPSDYIHFLQTIEHNGVVVQNLEEELELEDVELIDTEKHEDKK